MQNTMKTIMEKVELLDRLHNGRKGSNAKLRIVGTDGLETNQYFFIYGLDVIGKIYCTYSDFEKLCNKYEVDVDSLNIDSYIANIARQKDESLDERNWCFDSD